MAADLSSVSLSSANTTGVAFRDLHVQDGRSIHGRRRVPSTPCPVCLSFESDVDISLTQAEVEASRGCGPCSITICIYRLASQENENMHLKPPVKFNKTSSTVTIGPMVYNIFSTSQIPLYCGEYSTVPRPKDRTPLISEWIQSCILTHSGCNQADSQLPTRIIDLACPEGIKLCSGTELVGRYAALSHCWGKPPFPVPLSTTKATLLDREAQISEGELTKTFQDAITLARKLSVQYMWADSLCIVQDDEDEWNRESANMASVYENAYVVIAATEAAHGGIGCSARRSDMNENYTLCFTHLLSQNEEMAIYVGKRIDHNYFDPNNMFASRRDQQLPLLFRSWCLQERLLATRIVHLTQSEVFWECKSETLCECSKRVFSTRHVPKDLEEERLFIKRAWKTCSFPFELWHRTLTMYMKLDITKQSDRLPAVSGFAKRLQITGTGEYIAGLWRNNIFADMLWYGRNGERVEIWQAPSWSCACLKSNVSLSFAGDFRLRRIGLHGELDTENLLNNPRSRQTSDSPRFKTSLVSFENNPLRSDPTGEVKSASLTISAPTVEVSFHGVDEDGDFYVANDGAKVGFTPDNKRDFESHQLSISTTKLLCVWIGSIWERSKDQPPPQLLILKASLGIGSKPLTPNAFERVGCKSFYRSSHDHHIEERNAIQAWFDKAQVQIMKLV